jgi:DNA adenine methylase
MKYNKIRSEIKSPLRYPGGKTRAVKKIIPRIPRFKEFREPFVGGGSVFISVKQRVPNDISFWINDLNYDLYCFWSQIKENSERMITEVQRYYDEWDDGRALFSFLTNAHRKWSDFEKGVRFFVLNRITFSGTVESGGYSTQSFKRRFTQSSIERLKRLHELLANVKVTPYDYEKVVNRTGEDVFIFLDPPYFSTTDSRLYGKNGDLHTSFNHERFAKVMKKCPHKFLITYDDSPEVKELFDFATIEEWSIQYGMNNYKQNSAKRGKELFISNYETENVFDLIPNIKSLEKIYE